MKKAKRKKPPAEDEDYGEYFRDDNPPEPPKLKKDKLPTCTDHSGNPIKRLGPIAIRRVLDHPTNMTATSPDDHASVFCEERGVSLSRDGINVRKAVFTMCACHPSRTVSFIGPAGRDKLIRRFMKLLRDGKSYAYPDRPDPVYAERTEHPFRRKKKR